MISPRKISASSPLQLRPDPFLKTSYGLLAKAWVVCALAVGSIGLSNEGVEPRETRVGQDPFPALGGTNLPTHTVTITVLNATNDTPVGGAEITAPYAGFGRAVAPIRLTDAQGKFVCQIPIQPKEMRAQFSMFSITAQHSDFAGRGTTWTLSSGDILTIVPHELTIKLEPGILIGGVVEDQAGHPQEGVRVLLQGSGMRGYTGGSEPPPSHEYPEISFVDKAKPAAITDSKGRWTFAHFPKDLANLEVILLRPDDSRETFVTDREHNFYNRRLIALRALKDQSAVLSLPDGLVVHGIVVDESGRPLPGVEVREGYGAFNRVLISEFKTDAAGRFERMNRVPRQWIYTAATSGRATVSQVVEVRPGMAEVRLVMPAAKPLSIHVQDAAGQPVTGARIEVNAFRSGAQFLNWSGESDAEGRVVWTNAPLSEVALFARKEGLPVIRQFKALAGSSEKIVVLDPTASEKVKVHLKALDAVSRKPVIVRTVSIRCEGPWVPFRTAAEPRASECDIEVKTSDFRPGMDQSYVLRLEADGYDTLLTDEFNFAESDQDLELTMVPGVSPAGVVLLPDGRPADQVRIWARSGSGGSPLFANAPGTYYGDQMIKAQSAANGRFTLPALAADGPVVFTHPEGVFEVALAELKRNPTVKLQPWGAVEGQLTIGGEARSGVNIMLSTLSWRPDLGMHVVFGATTDSDGRFRFKQVPPGEYKIYRQYSHRSGPITESHQMPITVKPGEKRTVEYGGGGRLVIGQATTEPSGVQVNWQNDNHVLNLKQKPLPLINPDDFATAAAYQKAQQESYKSEAQIRHVREARAYQLLFETDGSFRVEDVPPGLFELRIQLTKPAGRESFRGYTKPEDELGALITDVTIPPGTNTFDLGTVVVEMKAAQELAKAAPLKLEASTLDGHALHLDQFHGRHVLLTFWTPWSERSTEQLSQIEKLQEQYAADKRIQFLGVSIDEDVEATREAVRHRGYGGTQARIEGKALADAAAAFNVELLPAVFLLDPQGRLISRDLEGQRLQQAVERALKSK